eukprot:scaffold360108_cov42-Prasinocladus_malaysianus.AAC.1
MCGQACGMYPCIGRLQEAKPGARNQKPAIITRRDEKVVIHPASVNSSIELPQPPEGLANPHPSASQLSSRLESVNPVDHQAFPADIMIVAD